MMIPSIASPRLAAPCRVPELNAPTAIASGHPFMTRLVTRAALALAVFALAAGLTGCAQPKAPAQAPLGLLDVTSRPGEAALLAGMRLYEDAQYSQAEQQLIAALKSGLASPRDQAAAHKLLAFIFCASNRTTECEAAFRAARRVDASFALSKSEAGHPLWGPVYQRISQ